MFYLYLLYVCGVQEAKAKAEKAARAKQEKAARDAAIARDQAKFNMILAKRKAVADGEPFDEV